MLALLWRYQVLTEEELLHETMYHGVLNTKFRPLVQPFPYGLMKKKKLDDFPDPCYQFSTADLNPVRTSFFFVSQNLNQNFVTYSTVKSSMALFSQHPYAASFFPPSLHVTITLQCSRQHVIV